MHSLIEIGTTQNLKNKYGIISQEQNKKVQPKFS
jgi:hypothetical protein